MEIFPERAEGSTELFPSTIMFGDFQLNRQRKKMEVDILRTGHYFYEDGRLMSFLTAEALAGLAKREPDKFRFDEKRGVLVCIKPEIIHGFDEAKLKELSEIGRNASMAAEKLKTEILTDMQEA